MNEIEKKFLVKEIPDKLDGFECEKIIQGYLNVSSDPVLRVRLKGDKYFLTYKSSNKKFKEKDYNICTEYELPISKEAFEHLKTKIDGNLISKTRYYIKLNEKLTAELDIFDGILKGLILVEVEFESETEVQNFTKPNWFGQDVSKDRKYRNSFLSKVEDLTEIIQ